MGSRISRFLIPLVLFILVLSFAKITYSYVSSPLGRFNVSAFDNAFLNTTYLNWTNNFNNIMNVSTNSTFNGSLIVKVLNDTISLTENYTQGNTQSGCLNLVIYNGTAYNNTIVANGTFNISFITLNCLPGRYSAPKFTVANASNQTDNANISVVLDLPINNTNLTTGIGSFNGVLPINYTTYQSYYFNTNFTPNATSVMINLSGWGSSSDVDAFLFDDSSTPVMEAKGTNKTATSEIFYFYYLPRNKFWEIRVFGNSTSAISYSGNIIYSTLNATNPTGGLSLDQLNYSAILANGTNNTNITLRNDGNITLSSVAQNIELYNARRFTGSGSANYSFMIPNSSLITRVKSILTWNGQSNYTLNMYNTSADLIGTSLNQYVQANTSGAASEVYNETTSIPSSSSIWTFEVKNNTNVTNNQYTLSVLMYVNSSNWFATNYSTTTFNTTVNRTDARINLTVPNNSIDGIYEGNISYLASNNAGISVPIWLNVTAPSLVFNGTTSLFTYRIDEDILANVTRSFNFWLNNTGSYNLTVAMTNSTNLSSTSTSYQPTLALNTTTDVPAGTGKVITVNVTFNSSMPAATYDGWIYINGTNSNVSLSGHPADSMNVTIRLNLTNLLVVNVSKVSGINGTNVLNSSLNENLTTKLNVTYLNGTPIETQTRLSATDISVFLLETNVSTRIPTTGNLTVSNGTNPIYCTSGCPSGTNFYYANSSVTSGQIGGIYEVHVGVNTTSGSNTFYGEGINKTLIINNTGLYMRAMNSTSISIANLSTYVFAVNITNYGGLAASSATINFSHSCNYPVSTPTYVNCPSTSFVPNPFTSSCVVKWTITGASTAQAACGATIVGTPSTIWYNPSGVTLSITTTLSSGSSSSSSASAAAAAAATPNVSLAFSLADTIVYVEQNKTNTSTAQVKNTGVSTQTVTFSVDSINSSWYSINDTNSSALSTGKVRGYLVTFKPENADVKDYSGSFKATGSASSATAAFKLRVLPGPEKRAEISSTFDQLNVNFTSLTDELSKTKNEGKNTTEAQQKYDMLKAKLDQANTNIKNGDYFAAYQLINDIKSLFTETKAALSSSTVPAGGGFNLGNLLGAQAGYLTYVLIGGGVAAGAFVAYLFWPSKAPGAAYKAGPTKPLLGESVQTSVKDRFQFMKKIKEFFSKLFNRGPKQTYAVK